MVEESEFINEDLDYLKNWLELVLEDVSLSKSIARKKKANLFFSISTTYKKNLDRPYATPLRSMNNIYVTGVVVNSINQAIIVASVIASHVNGILIDIEKKINTKTCLDEDVLRNFNININEKYDTLGPLIKKGFILDILKLLNPKTKFISYKPNDLTVDGVWGILALKLNRFENKTISIIGCGNIGFKLALKLAESGVNIKIYRRDFKKSKAMVEAIKIATPRYCNSTIDFFNSVKETAESCDVIIGASSGGKIITSEIVENMKADSILMDIGKGNIDRDAIEKAQQKGIEVLRGDITPSLLGFINQYQKSYDLAVNKIGRLNIDDEISILSGGLLGKNGEFVVDDFKNPTIIYGVSDGEGNLKLDLSPTEKIKLNKLRSYIKNKID